MKTKFYLKLTSIILFAAFAFNANSQDPVSDMMRAGASDVTKLAGLQVAPLGNSFAAGLGGGWYNTAKTHKFLGFDLTLSINMATIPDDEKVYDFASQQFDALTLKNGAATAEMPTLIAYDDVEAPEMVLNTKASNVTMAIPSEILNDPIAKAAFEYFLNNSTDIPATIDGSNLSIAVPSQQIGEPIKLSGMVPASIPFVAIPTPTVQLGIGLGEIGKNTDVMIRFVPGISAGDFSVGLFGFGVKHDIKQWIPGLKEIEVFDLAGVFGTTKMTATFDFSVTPDLYGDDVVDLSNAASWEGQGMEIGASATTFQIVASKKLLILTPTIGLGFTKTNFNVTMNGKYPLLKSGISAGQDPFIFDKNSQTAPISLNPEFAKMYVDDKDATTDYFEPGEIVNDGKFLPNLSVGLRLKLLILTVHAQYVIQPYTMYTAGFGLTLR